jgi:chromosome transmission fidelity protein 4
MIPGKRRKTPDLFGDGEDVKIGGDDDAGGEGYDLGMMDDDWIIDDIGGGMEDDPSEKDRLTKSGRDGFVKEMGGFRLYLFRTMNPF